MIITDDMMIYNKRIVEIFKPEVENDALSSFIVTFTVKNIKGNL